MERHTRSRLEHSPQWRSGRFRNETPWEWMKPRDYLGMMYDYVFSGKDRTPKRTPPSVRPDLTPYAGRSGNRLSATWLGHSTLLLNVDGVRIMTDPVFTRSLTMLGPWRYGGTIPVPVRSVPDPDAVIISHNHFDHLNEHSVRQLSSRARVFVTPLGVGDDLHRCGVAWEKIIELDWWQTTELPEGLRVTATPAQHFSGRRLNDRDKTLWASFVIEGRAHSVFFGGDSGYFDGFRRIGEKFGPFDMTFLETGAYSRYWQAVHMFPEETVQAHRDLGGSLLHPIHWGTFNLSLHPWYEPMDRLTREAERWGVETATPMSGQSTIFGSFIPQSRWWETPPP